MDRDLELKGEIYLDNPYGELERVIKADESYFNMERYKTHQKWDGVFGALTMGVFLAFIGMTIGVLLGAL